MKFIILSTNQDLIDSIGRYLKYLDSLADIKSFLIRNAEKEAYKTFLVIRNWLEGLFENDATEMKQTMAFLDLPVMDCSAIFSSGDDASGLLAMLYLSFPEIYWYFLMPPVEMPEKDDCLDKKTFEHFHVLLSQKTLPSEKQKLDLDRPVESFLHGYTSLFDPTGFRHFIIKNTLEKLDDTEEKGKTTRPFFCERKKKALVVDEELTYSYLHSYAAFKFGHRVMMASTKKILDSFNIKENGDRNASPFDLSFEDIYLSFPDDALKYESGPKHSLKKRDDLYTFFKKIPRRIFVTIGEHGQVKKENRSYRQSLKYNPDFKFYKMLYKPYAGIFNLQIEARLKKEKKKIKRSEDIQSGHSQPGRLGMIAGILIERSTRVLAAARRSNDAIYAAMLALQAQEILGGRTATESIKAVALKHRAEVTAECMFYGVEHNFDVKLRFKEIHEELCIIGMWFGKSKKDIMIYNSELNIVNELARVFMSYSQFDEEQDCLDKVRSLSRKIYAKRNKTWAWLVSPIRWYFEFLVGKLGRFIAALAGWTVVLTALYSIFLPQTGSPGIFKKIGDSFFYAVQSFFSLSVPAVNNGYNAPPAWIPIIGIILGFFHLGIFISHLYTVVSRR